MALYTLIATHPLLLAVFVTLILVDLLLRGLALYKSARLKQKVWFIVLIIVNTIGILPAIYLLLNKKK